MASKSFVYGGGDTWEPNGVIPWGENREFSLAWYEDAGVMLTQMYAYEVTESLQVAAGNLGIHTRNTFNPELLEAMQVSATFASINLRSLALTYGMVPEALRILPTTMASIDLREVVRRYPIPADFMQLSVTLEGIDLRTAVVVYPNYPAEPLNVSASMAGVTLA